MSGIEKIAEERRRQVNNLGYTAKHDKHHADGELTAAAAYYLGVSTFWPWDRASRPSFTTSDIDSLVKAGALIAAEIDRLEAS